MNILFYELCLSLPHNDVMKIGFFLLVVALISPYSGCCNTEVCNHSS